MCPWGRRLTERLDPALRDEILQSNLDPGSKNAFTMHPEHRYPAGSPLKPYRFATVEYKHRADGNSSFSQAFAGFFKRGLEKCVHAAF